MHIVPQLNLYHAYKLVDFKTNSVYIIYKMRPWYDIDV